MSTNQWLATSSWSNQQNGIAFSKLGTSLDKIQQFPRNNFIRNSETTKKTPTASDKIGVQNTLHPLSNLQCCFANVLWNLSNKKITGGKETRWNLCTCIHAIVFLPRNIAFCGCFLLTGGDRNHITSQIFTLQNKDFSQNLIRRLQNFGFPYFHFLSFWKCSKNFGSVLFLKFSSSSLTSSVSNEKFL